MFSSFILERVVNGLKETVLQPMLAVISIDVQLLDANTLREEMSLKAGLGNQDLLLPYIVDSTSPTNR